MGLGGTAPVTSGILAASVATRQTEKPPKWKHLAESTAQAVKEAAVRKTNNGRMSSRDWCGGESCEREQC